MVCVICKYVQCALASLTVPKGGSGRIKIIFLLYIHVLYVYFLLSIDESTLKSGNLKFKK